MEGESVKKVFPDHFVLFCEIKMNGIVCPCCFTIRCKNAVVSFFKCREFVPDIIFESRVGCFQNEQVADTTCNFNAAFILLNQGSMFFITTTDVGMRMFLSIKMHSPVQMFQYLNAHL